MNSLSQKKSGGICIICGKYFKYNRNGYIKKYCSHKCYGVSMKNIKHQKTYKNICVVCFCSFYSSKKVVAFCSPQCQRKTRIKVYKSKLKLICKKCGKEFFNRAGVKYCSQKCYHSFYYYGDLSPRVKKCLFCKNDFSTSKKFKRYCSVKCNLQHYRQKNKRELNKKRLIAYHLKNPRLNYAKKCVVCNKNFETKNKKQIYCSPNCSTKSYRKQPRVISLRRHDSNKRRHQKKELNNFTIEQWEKTKKHFKGACAYCRKKVNNLQQDHFISLKEGGTYTQNNIVPACPSCNHSKNSKSPYQWLTYKFKNGEVIYKNIKKYLDRY